MRHKLHWAVGKYAGPVEEAAFGHSERFTESPRGDDSTEAVCSDPCPSAFVCGFIPSGVVRESRSEPRPKSPGKSLCKSRREPILQSSSESAGKPDYESPREQVCESPSKTTRMSRCNSPAESPGKSIRQPHCESPSGPPREPFRERFPLWFAGPRFWRSSVCLTEPISTT
jgi:hypothetical protein